METTRRDLMVLGAAGLLASMALPGQAAEDDAHQAEQEAIEQENIKLVTEFCESWESLDLDRVTGFLSDKIVYQMMDNMPLIHGKEAFIKQIQAFLNNVEEARWDISRSYCIGNIVINQRVDNFEFKNNRADAHFPVVGLFLIKDGRIVEWKDYLVPKTKAKS